jgi:hypothetical protein
MVDGSIYLYCMDGRLLNARFQTLFNVFLPMLPYKKKKEKKVLLPNGVSRSAAHAVLVTYLNLNLRVHYINRPVTSRLTV